MKPSMRRTLFPLLISFAVRCHPPSTSCPCSCEQLELVRGWREAWSAVPNTTDPLAPFGLVTLASSGSEGADSGMGAMRWAQTVNYGVLPAPTLPNTFLAQVRGQIGGW